MLCTGPQGLTPVADRNLRRKWLLPASSGTTARIIPRDLGLIAR